MTYISEIECKLEQIHGTWCDSDGYCNYCGEQLDEEW